MSAFLRRFCFAFTVLCLTVSQTHAGLYHVKEKCPFAVNSQLAKPLIHNEGFVGDFPLRFLTLGNLINPSNLVANGDRDKQLTAIKSFKAESATPQETASYAAELIRLGQAEKALSLLQPLSRGRTASYVVLMNLAHTYAVLGDWSAALRTHEVALDYDATADLPTYKPEQIAWILKLEKEVYKKWLLWNERNARIDPATQKPIELLGIPEWTMPGQEKYQTAETLKINQEALSDKIAMTQQMLLWKFDDSNLFWLLAELYAVDGQFQISTEIFNKCVDTRQFSNRKVLMEHRSIAMNEAKKLADEKAALAVDQPAETGLPSSRTVILTVCIFAPVALLLLYLQLRRIVKK